MRILAIAGLVLDLAAGHAGATPAPGPKHAHSTIALTYSFAVFGLRFGQLQYAADLEPTHYAAELHFRTSGLTALLWKSKI
jgi:hypothetical protein